MVLQLFSSLRRVLAYGLMLGISLFAVLALASSVFAVGISPGTVIIENMTSESEATREFVLVRSDASEEVRVGIQLDGDAADYVTVLNAEEGVVTLPAGQAQTSVEFSVAPENLPEGFYDVKFRIAPVSTDADGTGQGSGVVAGAVGVIRFQVTNNEIADFDIANPLVPDVEEISPVAFTFRVENNGNVAARPSKIDVTFERKDGVGTPYTQTIKSSDIPFVKGFQTEDVAVVTEAILEAEDYNATFVFYGADDAVMETLTTGFRTLPEGSLEQSGEFTAFSADKTEYVANELAVLTGTFTNDGTAGVNARLIVDISRDGQRLEFVKIDEVYVGPGKTAELEATFRPSEAGTYEASGYVAFGVNETDEIATTFIVGELSSYGVFAGLAGGSIVLILVVALIRKRKRKGSGPTAGSADGVAPTKGGSGA